MQNKKQEEEARAWKKVNQNSRYFFAYAKKISQARNPIGPFIKEDGSVIQEPECETLNDTYYSFYNKNKDEKHDDSYFESEEDVNPKISRLNNVYFNSQDVIKTIKSVSS